MQYATTQLQRTKSYPTYQLYLTATSRTYQPDEILRICVLETLTWLRSRLQRFPDLPEDIRSPEPENFREFPKESLHTFSFDAGGSVDVIWSPKHQVWSFCIMETDMGANIGTDRERPPVIGRTFRTEMAYNLIDERVEIGIRTICAEPYDCDAPCEVFRPTVVKALAANPNLILRHNGLNIDGKAIILDKKDVMERVSETISAERFDLPVVIVTEPKAEVSIPRMPELTQPSTLNVTKGFTPQVGLDNLKVDFSKTDVKTSSFQDKAVKKSKTPAKPSIKITNEPVKKTELPEFPYVRLAESIVGFGVVLYVPDKLRGAFAQRIGIDLQAGEIAVKHGSETEHFSQKSYEKDIEAFYQTLKADLKTSPKRRSYQFGEVVFHSQARVLELHNRRHETESLEEQCRLYHLENKELREQVKELTQEKADMQKAWESERVTQKKLLTAQEETEKLTEQLRVLQALQNEREEAYRRAATVTDFYRKKADIAAGFPDSRERVCDWAEQEFSDELVLTSDARSALRKFTGQLDVAILCDGILYLSAYARYRRGEIGADELSLYAERYKWEVQGCGKETLQMRRSDYLMTFDGKQYLMDQHIKYGISAQSLVRIYFHWEEALSKIIIGYMPGHLPTVKKGT